MLRKLNRENDFNFWSRKTSFWAWQYMLIILVLGRLMQKGWRVLG
jgi:hypothetical protein